MLFVRNKFFSSRVLFVFALGLVLLGACSGAGNSGQENADISPIPTAADAAPTTESQSTISQWAVSAEASSVFADPEWSPEKALGPPDSPGCGDYQFAWASAASDGVDQLTVFFAVPVLPVEINIHQSFNPDQVVKVEVYNPDREVFFTVLQKNPETVDRPCPYQLSVSVSEIDFLTDRVRITVDQSQLGLGWNEIDAVELVGIIPD